MKKTKKISDNKRWQELLDSRNSTTFSCLVDNKVLIRRVPLNYEVRDKDHVDTPHFYSTLRNAVKAAMECLLVKKLKRHDKLEEIIKAIDRLHKKVDDVIPDITTITDNLEDSCRKRGKKKKK
jgi:hypothetical protein